MHVIYIISTSTCPLSCVFVLQKKCVIEELYQFEFFSELLKELGAEIALSMP